MSGQEVSVTVAGRVVVSADLSQFERDMERMRQGVIGSGAPVQGGDPATVGSAPPTAAPDPRAGYVGSPEEAARQAVRMYMGIDANMAGARTAADIRRLEGKLDRATRYGERSGDDRLVEALKDLRKSLEDRKGALSGGGMGGGQSPAQPPPSPNNPAPPAWLQTLSQTLSRQGQGAVAGGVTRALGGGGIGSLAGGAAGALLGGPAAWIVGGLAAAGAAFSVADRYITDKNKAARLEYQGQADLARQYGIDQDLMGTFRPGGWTNPRFAHLGYDATEAARVAALYDRPEGRYLADSASAQDAARRYGSTVTSGTDPGGRTSMYENASQPGMVRDVESILQFARSTGMNSDRVAALSRELGVAGVGGMRAGNADDALRIMKGAVTDGVQQGIAGSTTMQNMLGFVKGNSAEGRSVNAAGMAFFAQMSDRLNLTGSTTLRGEAGAGVIQNVLNGIGNPNDPGLEYLLLNAVGAPSGANVGFGSGEGALRKVYDQLRASSPLEAGRFLLDRIKGGKNPGLTGQAMQGIDDAANGNVPLQLRLYESAFNISREQAASLIGNGGAKLFSSDPKMLQRYLQGQGLTQDVQGGNRINNDSMSLSVAERDRAMMASLGNLDFLGGMEKSLGEIKGDIARIRYKFMTWAGNYENGGGSMAGTTGSGYRDPRGVPIASASASFVPPSTATPAAAGRPAAAPRSALDRTMWALAQVETSGGRNITTSSSGAEGLYQIQPQNISNSWKSPVGGPGGWDKQYLGIDAQNPDGTLVSTFEQGSAWLKAHPDQANRIATLVTQERMARIRKSWDAQDYDYSESDVAGMAGAWWTSPDAAIMDGNRVRLPGQLRRQQNPYEKALKTLSPGQYFDKMQGLYGKAPSAAAATQVPKPPAAVVPPSTGVNGLDPKFNGRIQQLVAAYRKKYPNMPVPYILEGFRTLEKQAQYYAQGRTTPGAIITKARPGESMHNYGFAADLAFTLPNGTRLHQDDPRSLAAYRALGPMAAELGLQWGGSWGAGLVDMPHFEPMNYSWQQARRGTRPKGYATGGWTGSGPTHEEAGVVHYEEFVVKAGPAARYRRELERANAGLDLHAQQGSSVSGRIELNVTGGASFQIPGLPANAQHKIDVLWHQFLAATGTILTQQQPTLSPGGPR